MKTNPGSTSLIALCWVAFLVVIVLGLWLAAGPRIELPVLELWAWLP